MQETLYYFDGVVLSDKTPAELEAEIQRLTEESAKLKSWPKT